MLLLIFHYLHGCSGDESTPSECEEKQDLPNSGLFLDMNA